MSLKKRLFLLVAFVAVLSFAAAVPGEAQGRRGGRARSVVVAGRGYHRADPFWYGYGYPFSPTISFRSVPIPIPAITASTLAAPFGWR